MKNGEFSEEDITKAKDYILAGVDAINEEQDSQILFLFGQELTKMPLTIEEHKNNIQKVTKEQIVEFANKIQLNTIYFWRTEETMQIIENKLIKEKVYVEKLESGLTIMCIPKIIQEKNMQYFQ